jgi:hypothetical protein
MTDHTKPPAALQDLTPEQSEALDLPPLTATEAKERLDTALAKPAPHFPFTHRDRYEVAYTFLVWELLMAMERYESVPRSVLISALAKAAGELA